jgi:capsular exopolysaccharide synthesis family protein
MELLAYIKIIYRHFWVVMLLFAASIGGAFFYSEMQDDTVEYAATATLFINPAADNPTWPYQALDGPQLAEIYSEFVSDEDFANRVASNIDAPITTEAVQAAIATEYEGEDQFFSITAIHPDPELAQRIANTTAEMFVAENSRRIRTGQQSFGSGGSGTDIPFNDQSLDLQLLLQEELTNINRQIAEVEVEISQLQNQPRSERLDLYVSDLLDEMFNLRAQRADILMNMPTSVLTPASVPTVPVPQESMLRILLQAAAIGLILGVGMAFLLEYLDNSIRTADMLTKIYGMETQGVIGTEQNRQSWSRSDHTSSDALVHSERSPLADAFRLFRIRLSMIKLRSSVHSVMITSAVKGEGKTFVAANLAVSLARHGIRTILVDVNLNHPNVHTLFQLPQEPGLIDAVVEHRADLEQALYHTEFPNLRVLPCGSVVTGASDLVGSPYFMQIMERLTDLADIVIYDTPALDASTETISLATGIDVVFQVVLANKTPIHIVRRGRETLESVGAPIVGPILNRAKHKRLFVAGTVASPATPTLASAPSDASRDQLSGHTEAAPPHLSSADVSDTPSSRETSANHRHAKEALQES